MKLYFVNSINVNINNVNINIENLYPSEDLVTEATEIETKNNTTTNKKFEWFVVAKQIFQSVLSTAISRTIIETFLK